MRSALDSHDSSEPGEVVLLICPGEERRCELCRAGSLAALIERRRGGAGLRASGGTHLIELRESMLSAPPRRFRTPPPTLRVELYLDGIPLARCRFFELLGPRRGRPRVVEHTFEGSGAREAARSVVARLAAEQERVCRGAAQDEAAWERFQALSVALRELEGLR